MSKQLPGRRHGEREPINRPEGPRRVDFLTVDDDEHGCYVSGLFVGSTAYLGEDAIDAMRITALWLGYTPVVRSVSPQSFAELGGKWPLHLHAWNGYS